MARIICLISFFVLISCASSKKDEEQILDVDMRSNLFSVQNHYENLIEENDSMFFSIEENSCLKNWSKDVKKYKKKLKSTTKKEVRNDSWFSLGNCYNYVKKFNLSLYYYDLVLSSGIKSNRMYSIMYFNMGQIYELQGQTKLAQSYYQNSLNYGDATKLSLFKLGQLSFKENEFQQSNAYYAKLGKFFPKSNMLKFLMGVNFYHLNDNALLVNKVLKKMDEKSIGRIMLSMAADLISGKNNKNLEADLNNLDVRFSLHKQFKGYLLNNIGR